MTGTGKFIPPIKMVMTGGWFCIPLGQLDGDHLDAFTPGGRAKLVPRNRVGRGLKRVPSGKLT